ncbi:MAG: ribosome biogenesis GTPase Der [Rhodospirillaceae bacterium]|nr:ribosome biogenesis GTPase Der [Rhodospirillaceae bacterium]|tara:strand:+ start:2427 stop:3803 length:1377 start_codon:yes stop_codon:yes gene_type:complete
MSFTVAVIGRPNVGKSTLFNRLTGKRLAIVDNIPGVTRDRREGGGGIAGLDFTVIDTAGLDDGGGDSLEARMREQTERALDDADVALFLIDARAGVTPLDEHFADWLRRHQTPVIVVANKCEGGAGQGGLLEAYGLGLGDPVALSAEHGEGLDGLYEALLPFGPPGGPADAADGEAEAADDAWKTKPLKLAIVGRPNAGKSTIINKLLGDERMLTGPEAGITRDSISVSWDWNGRPIRLIDTAGLRRKARVTGKLEGLSVGDALRAIRFAEVVVLIADATLGLDKQDLSIARLVIEEGRALVLAVNKWDLAKDRKAVMSGIEDRLMTSLPQVRGIPVVPCSAKTGKGMDKLLAAVFSVYETWNRRVETGALNRWLEAMTGAHPPPVAKGRRIKIRYMTQAKTRPPTFIVFASRKDALPESYVRYLINGLRESFDLPAVPIRVHLRAGKNPYVKGKGKG